MEKIDSSIPVARSCMPPEEAYMELFSRVWHTRWLSNRGGLVLELEEKLRQRLKVSHLVTFANGHLALDCLIRAMKLGSGEIITTPYTFVSTSNAVVMNGLTPVFCDIKETDCTIDEEKIEALITPRTKAILPVHVYGFPCNYRRIQDIADKHGLKVIYDAAHAFNVEVDGVGIGTVGDASMFSTHATKVFHTIEGGFIVSARQELAEELCRLQNFGLDAGGDVKWVSLNAKMTESNAAMGLANLPLLDRQIAHRKELVEHYLERLAEVPGIRTFRWDAPNVKYNYAYFPILVTEKDFGMDRDALSLSLSTDYNILSRKYFYPALNDMTFYRNTYPGQPTPIARRLASQVLSLPLFAELTHHQVDYICDAIKEVFQKRLRGSKI